MSQGLASFAGSTIEVYEVTDLFFPPRVNETFVDVRMNLYQWTKIHVTPPASEETVQSQLNSDCC